MRNYRFNILLGTNFKIAFGPNKSLSFFVFKCDLFLFPKKVLYLPGIIIYVFLYLYFFKS